MLCDCVLTWLWFKSVLELCIVTWWGLWLGSSFSLCWSGMLGHESILVEFRMWITLVRRNLNLYVCVLRCVFEVGPQLWGNVEHGSGESQTSIKELLCSAMRQRRLPDFWRLLSWCVKAHFDTARGAETVWTRAARPQPLKASYAASNAMPSFAARGSRSPINSSKFIIICITSCFLVGWWTLHFMACYGIHA